MLLVKLRQYPGTKRKHICVDTLSAPWRETGIAGNTQLILYESDHDAEQISLYRMAPGCEVPEHTHPGGEELFVLEGGLEDQNGRYKKGCWGGATRSAVTIGRSPNQAASSTPNWAT